MSNLIEFLPWDTDFFGYRIGQVHLDRLDPEDLGRVRDEASADGIECVYGFLDPTARDTAYSVQGHGFRFVESSILLSLRRDHMMPESGNRFLVREGTVEDLATVEGHAALMSPWGRFSMDPHFGTDASRRLHLAWVRRAAACTTGEYALHVVEKDDEVVGFMTSNWTDEPLLDGIGTTAPGTGASTALVASVRERVETGPIYFGTVSSRNIPMQRWLASLGFRPVYTRYTYHLWTHEEVVP